MPTEYSKTVPFVGHTAKALDVARTTFMGQGFQIVANSDYELRVTGPGLVALIVRPNYEKLTLPERSPNIASKRRTSPVRE